MDNIFLEFAFELWRSPGVRGVQVFAGMLGATSKVFTNLSVVGYWVLAGY